jgi:hypothetical protein
MYLAKKYRQKNLNQVFYHDVLYGVQYCVSGSDDIRNYSLTVFFAVPMLHWLTLVAKRREHRVSWMEVAMEEMLTNIRLQGGRGKTKEE